MYLRVIINIILRLVRINNNKISILVPKKRIKIKLTYRKPLTNLGELSRLRRLESIFLDGKITRLTLKIESSFLQCFACSFHPL